MQEVIEWLAKPENLQQADNLPPFIENLDVGAYVSTALPIAGFVLGVNVLDEVVQRGVALQRKVPSQVDKPALDDLSHIMLRMARKVMHNLLGIPYPRLSYYHSQGKS